MQVTSAVNATQTILLAEGDASLRRWLGVLLREAGYNVVEAGTAPDVLRQLRGRVPIHLVIADTRLGRMPVWEIAQSASAFRPGVPMVQLIESWAERVPTYRRGNAILWKPFTLPALLGVIRSLISPEVADADDGLEPVEFSVGPYTFYPR